MKAAASLLLGVLAASVHAAAETRQPNVLVIISDDHRHDALGVVQREMGDKANYPFFETPALDRLAAGGVRFRHAFVTHSLCSPSRATMLTGLYTRQHGIKGNAQPFTSTDTWPALLGKSGWATGYFGKWHMGAQRERPGFAEVATFIDQGVYENCPFVVDGKDTETEGWVDDVTTNYAIDFIKEHRDTPFAMVVGYKTPHDKRTPPPRHEDRWKDHKFPEPPSFRDVAPWRKDNPPAPWKPKSPDRLAYFQTLAGMDDNIGRLLETLEGLKLADDTLVIYTSVTTAITSVSTGWATSAQLTRKACAFRSSCATRARCPSRRFATRWCSISIWPQRSSISAGSSRRGNRAERAWSRC
jgi:N-acetylglucosamine-6-sulfatase